MNITVLLAVGLVALTAILILIFAIIKRKAVPSRRVIPAIDQLRQALDRSVEGGTRVHLSLGKGRLVSPQGAAGLAGLSTLNSLSSVIQSSDLPMVTSSGEPSLSILSQDILRLSNREHLGSEEISFRQSRLTGLTDFSYAAGTIPVISNNNVSTNVLLGDFGIEAGLIMESALRNNGTTVAASDDISGQAVMFASTGESLVGEELFAVSEYLNHTPVHAASLTVQDILRWGVIACIFIGAILKLGGVI
ncbi:MAG TPA: DUF6754 domain-containing protein [Anaerolineales bacterium]|nr:DUF6754 domain-containing protein [Anaerolineales bacterium]